MIRAAVNCQLTKVVLLLRMPWKRSKNLGFIHDGFTIGYTAVPRWRYLKDLTGITD